MIKLLTDFDAGIWVNWWASSNEAEPGKHTGYYLGIYAMLGVIGMICLMVGCWSVIQSYNSPGHNSS